MRLELETLRDEAATLLGFLCLHDQGAENLGLVASSLGRMLARINAARGAVPASFTSPPIGELDAAPFEAIIEWAQHELGRKGRRRQKQASSGPEPDSQLVAQLRGQLELAREALSVINVRAAAALGERIEPSGQSLLRRQAPRQEGSNQGRPRERERTSAPQKEAKDASAPNAGERRMLTVLASFSPLGLTRYQLGFLARVAASSGTFSNYFSAQKPHIVALPGKRYTATPAAISEYGGPVKALRTHKGRSDAFKARLNAGERRMLEALETEPTQQLDRELLGQRARVASSSGTFSNYLSRLVRCDLVVTERGQPVRLSPWLVKGT